VVLNETPRCRDAILSDRLSKTKYTGKIINKRHLLKRGKGGEKNITSITMATEFLRRWARLVGLSDSSARGGPACCVSPHHEGYEKKL